MPRSNRPKKTRKQLEEPAELNLDLARRGTKRIETRRGEDYAVQPTTGQNAEEGKTWICPNCHKTIAKGTPHLVAWPVERSVDLRRHFHTNCWAGFTGVIL
jgi:hypothetical protein